MARASSISRRQAYRHLDRARQPKRPLPVGDAKAPFTVKLSRSPVDKLRTYSASAGSTLSEIAGRTLLAVLPAGEDVANRPPARPRTVRLECQLRRLFGGSLYDYQREID